jgi:hypothetical protein
VAVAVAMGMAVAVAMGIAVAVVVIVTPCVALTGGAAFAAVHFFTQQATPSTMPSATGTMIPMIQVCGRGPDETRRSSESASQEGG